MSLISKSSGSWTYIVKKMFSQPINPVYGQQSLEKHTIPLGRWAVDNSDEIINLKIDLANEDNCGPCGQYIIRLPQKVTSG